MPRITTSMCAAAEAAICSGCAKELAFESDGVGCPINLEAEGYGTVPSEWDMELMTCSEYKIGGES